MISTTLDLGRTSCWPQNVLAAQLRPWRMPMTRLLSGGQCRSSGARSSGSGAELRPAPWPMVSECQRYCKGACSRSLVDQQTPAKATC